MKCPDCFEEIPDNAVTCRFCGAYLLKGTAPASVDISVIKNMDNAQILTSIGELEEEIIDLEKLLSDGERERKTVQTNYISGVIGLLIGIVLLFFYWICGGILILAGLLALITGIIKRNRIDNATRNIESDLSSARKKISKLRTQMAIQASSPTIENP